MMLLADADDGGFFPPFAIFCIFGLPVLLWFAMRYMKHRERMAMIRQGVAPPEFARQMTYQPQASSFDPRIGQQPMYVRQNGKRKKNRGDCGDDATPDDQLRKGIRLSFIGLAVTIGLSFIGVGGGHDGSFTLGPWLLGGLVPLFVGLSQIVNGVLSGADVSSFRRGAGAPQQPYGAPPPGGNGANTSAGGPASQPGYPGPYDPSSYTYRPGFAPEIDAPPRPPERR